MCMVEACLNEKRHKRGLAPSLVSHSVHETGFAVDDLGARIFLDDLVSGEFDFVMNFELITAFDHAMCAHVAVRVGGVKSVLHGLVVVGA